MNIYIYISTKRMKQNVHLTRTNDEFMGFKMAMIEV